MRRSRLINPVKRRSAAWFVLLLAAFAMAGAQAQTQAGGEFSPAYDAAHETSLTGTIQEVNRGREPGTPAGMRVMVAASQGATEAHLGPYLDKETQDALRAGTVVQVTGAMSSFHGKQVLLARQIVFSGRTLTLRSPQGFLLRPKATHAKPSNSARTEAATKGGSL